MRREHGAKRSWWRIPMLALLLSALSLQGCIIPRTIGKTVGGVVRGTGKAVEATTDVVSAPLK